MFKLKTATAIVFILWGFAACADEEQLSKGQQTVKADYITDCRSGSCAKTDASLWSDEAENWDGVAVSVRMGTQPAKSDQETREWLAGGLEHFGAKKYKFFFEQNDATATGISFHVRGGTSDLYTWDREDLVSAVETYARRANDPNFAKSNGTSN